MKVQQLGELGLIQQIRESGRGRSAPGVRTGIGDDAAVLDTSPGAALIVTTDLLIEGVHFRRASASPHDIGWKAMAVNLSDVAAMGGSPRWALVALALPDSAEAEDVHALYRGMREAADLHEVSIVGGDTSVSLEGWFITVTLIGEHAGVPRLRSMARPGDAVAVTGTLGRSAAGLAALAAPSEGASGDDAAALEEVAAAHLRPVPRVAEGRWLGAQSSVHALMDSSDGVATDLGHICRASHVAARVALDRLPVSPAVRRAARVLRGNVMEWATGGGEDYELLLTCDRDAAPALAEGLRRETGTSLTVIGEIASGAPGVTWVDASGATVRVRGGYEHFRG